MKAIKGEKYIYLAMAYSLAKQSKGVAFVGDDNGYKQGHYYWRKFVIQKYEGKELLIETKSSNSGADFSRVFEVKHYSDERPSFFEYFNESGENCSKRWVH